MEMRSFNRAIAQIYAAASDFELWPEALRAIEDATGSAGAVIDFVPKAPRIQPLTLAGRFTNEQCATYANEYQHICRRIRYGLEHPERPVHYDALVLSEPEMDRDPVYDFLRRHGLRYYIGGNLPEIAHHQVYWSLQRSPQQGHVERPDIENFVLISQHLAQACSLAAQIGAMRTDCSVGFEALEAVACGVIVLTRDLRIIHANGRAETIFASGDGLDRVAGRLTTACPHRQAELERLLAGAAAQAILPNRGRVRLPRPSGKTDYALVVAPLTVARASPFVEPPALMVTIRDPAQDSAVALEDLTELYGLTAAEARLALLVGQGDRVDRAAARLGVTEQTARTQLKMVFRKLGVHRQPEVVRILAAMPLR